MPWLLSRGEHRFSVPVIEQQHRVLLSSWMTGAGTVSSGGRNNYFLCCNLSWKLENRGRFTAFRELVAILLSLLRHCLYVDAVRVLPLATLPHSHPHCKNFHSRLTHFSFMPCPLLLVLVSVSVLLKYRYRFVSTGISIVPFRQFRYSPLLTPWL